MPKQVRAFEFLGLGAVAIALIMFLSVSKQILSIGESGMPQGIVVFAVAATFGFYILLAVMVLVTARRRSNIAKWLLIALFGYAFGSAIGTDQLNPKNGFYAFASMGFYLCGLAAIYFLFTSESRAWFKGGVPARDASA